MNAFDVDQLVADCRATLTEDVPSLAVRDVLNRVLSDTNVADVLGRNEGGLERLHVSDELTILNLVWAPGMRLMPHDHNMWATVCSYGGVEDNEFFRLDGDRLVESGGKSVNEGEVLVLGDDTIHLVQNVTDRLVGTIHVYGGDFFMTPRTEWDPETNEPHPWSPDSTMGKFAEANKRYHAEHHH